MYSDRTLEKWQKSAIHPCVRCVSPICGSDAKHRGPKIRLGSYESLGAIDRFGGIERAHHWRQLARKSVIDRPSGAAGTNFAQDQWMVMADVHGCARFKISAQILCHRRQRASDFLMSGVSYASVVCPRGNRQVIQRTRLAKAGLRICRLVCLVVPRRRGACFDRGRSRSVTRRGFPAVKIAILPIFAVGAGRGGRI